MKSQTAMALLLVLILPLGFAGASDEPGDDGFHEMAVLSSAEL